MNLVASRRPRKPRKAIAPRLSLIFLITCMISLWILAIFYETTIFDTRHSSLVLLNYFGPAILEPIHRIETLQSLQASNSDTQETFCCLWDVTVDQWWTENPTWEVVLQNRTHQCFRPIPNRHRVALLQSLHSIQWQSVSCSSSDQYLTKPLSNSGWGADISHVVDGLKYALQHNVPVIPRFPVPWQYTQGRTQAGEAVCPSRDLNCYFLPLSNCSTATDIQRGGGPVVDPVRFWNPWQGFQSTDEIRWILEYATRPQTWLRRKAVILANTIPLPSPCSVIHVRRGDVVLHGKFSRAYHKISEYLQTARHLMSPNILLLTDDANAVTEALAHRKLPRADFPLTWYYIDRPRHHGAEGGFENPIPSDNAEWEVVVLHATFLLIQRCNLLVHSKSNLADYFFAVMKEANPNAQHIDLDADRNHYEIHNLRNMESVKLSKSKYHVRGMG